MSIDIVYMRKDLIRPWRAAVEEVAAEKRYLGRVTLPPFDPATKPDPNLPPLPASTPVPAARLLPEGLSDEDYAVRFLQEFGIEPGGYGYFRDASGGIVSLSERLFLTRDQSGAVTGSKANKFDRGAYMLLLADTIRDPDEIWADWARVASGIVLKRSYLRSFLLPDEKSLFVRFEWSSRGWIATTGFQTNARYIRNFRKGAMLYRRK